MQTFGLSRITLLILVLGIVSWWGCKAKQEAESISRNSTDSRQTTYGGVSHAAMAAPARTPDRPPVIVKAPKMGEPVAPPPVEKSAAPASTVAPSASPDELAVTADRAALKNQPSVNAPDSGALPPPAPAAPPAAPLENDLSNPLRAESFVASASNSPSAPSAEIGAQESVADHVPKMRAVTRAKPPASGSISSSVPEPSPVVAETPAAAAPTFPAPLLPPPASGDQSQPKDRTIGDLPTTDAAAGTIPPAPPAPPTSSAAPPPPSPTFGAPSSTAAALPGADYTVVKLFYGTDRAALGTVAAKRPVWQLFLMLTLTAAMLTAALALLAYRLLRWRTVKAAFTLSLSATIFLGALAGYAAVCGRLPGQSAVAEKPAMITYGDERGALELGSCEVSIPKRHEVGELESPSMLRLEFQEDPMKHVVLANVAPEPASAFYASLRASVAKSKEPSALVFIHGFNVTFADAARRTAQIAYDLKFAGVPLFYSWPSQGKLLDYSVDETNAVWTVPHLRRFLTDVARQSGAKQIHLIAHSMGNRALTGALKDLAMQPADSARVQFSQVLLTAPDIDADVFKSDIAPAITKTAERVTLYASSNDAALLLSKKLHGYPRAGEAGSDIVIVPGMDTIDVTAVDTSLLGHSYYGDSGSGSVLSDFVEVLEDAKPADQRKWLRAEFLGAAKYWVFRR